MQRDVPKVRRFGERDTKKEYTTARLRLMDLYCRHFFKRFRTTFETRRVSHFSKSPPRVRAGQKIAIDSLHSNGFELNHDLAVLVSHILGPLWPCVLGRLKIDIDNRDVNFLHTASAMFANLCNSR